MENISLPKSMWVKILLPLLSSCSMLDSIYVNTGVTLPSHDACSHWECKGVTKERGSASSLCNDCAKTSAVLHSSMFWTSLTKLVSESSHQITHRVRIQIVQGKSFLISLEQITEHMIMTLGSGKHSNHCPY